MTLNHFLLGVGDECYELLQLRDHDPPGSDSAISVNYSDSSIEELLGVDTVSSSNIVFTLPTNL